MAHREKYGQAKTLEPHMRTFLAEVKTVEQ